MGHLLFGLLSCCTNLNEPKDLSKGEGAVQDDTCVETDVAALSIQTVKLWNFTSNDLVPIKGELILQGEEQR